MADETDDVRLSQLGRELRAAGWRPPSYRDLWAAAVDLRIPAHTRNNLWHFNRRDLAAIAAALELEKTEEASTAAA